MVDDEKLVADLEAEWRDALFAKDEARLRAILHPRFQLVGVRASGFVAVDADGWLTALKDMDVANLDVKVSECVDLGDTLVATVEACWTVRYLGQLIEERVLLTDVWVKVEGRWQVVRRHSSAIPVGVGKR
ncbi:nuclear transport factor 2 family protein [Sphingomicrobium nitratireducens]|uniref:nuclear transport factor 2 family protein n=1 Tax=Sphingomicrobium nitratireducens TaxID=2964666 RepID=UPI002240A480